MNLKLIFHVPSGMPTPEYDQLRKYIASIFSITEEEWSFHRNLLSRKKLFKGEFLVEAGEVCNYVSFINRGSFRAYWDVDGHETTKNFFFENEYASDYESFLTRKPARINVKAMEDCELVELDYESVQSLYEQYPVWQKYGRLIAESLFLHLAQRSRDLLSKSPEELYLDLMHTRPHIIERVPLLHIASYLGVQPESLSRIRKRVMEVKRSA
ncbi:MAG TPA: Crp/Fnr family transcriptional regulator [Ohtaekwangia sp.]